MEILWRSIRRNMLDSNFSIPYLKPEISLRAIIYNLFHSIYTIANEPHIP